MKNINQTINIITENQPGVLYRIADVFLRRKINIESLTVFKITGTEHSRFTIEVQANEDTADKLLTHIEKIIEVKKVWRGGDTQ